MRLCGSWNLCFVFVVTTHMHHQARKLIFEKAHIYMAWGLSPEFVNEAPPCM